MKVRVHETGGPSCRTAAGVPVAHGVYVVGDGLSTEDAEQFVKDGRAEYVDDKPVKQSKAKADDHLA